MSGQEQDETDKERVDRELKEMLEELRVMIPGAEVLFAFLLGVAFTSRFADVTQLQREVYFGVLVVTAAATALLIAPAAHHRLTFRDGDKERLLVTGTRLTLAALVLLLFAISGVVFLVANLLYTTLVSVVAAAALLLWFGWFWFLLPRRLGSPVPPRERP